MAVEVNLPSVGWSALVDSRLVVVAEEAPCSVSEVVALSIVDPCEESLLHRCPFILRLTGSDIRVWDDRTELSTRPPRGGPILTLGAPKY